MKTNIATIALLSAFPTLSSAALNAVFEYEFDTSYDSSSTAVSDLSGAGNHATVTGENGGANIAVVTDIPTGGSQGTHSLNYSSTYGVVTTNAIDLLNNADVIANGGYTMTASFKGLSNNTRKIIDYAGTEYIGARSNNGGEVVIGISNTVPMILTTTEGLNVTDWNQITYSFAVTNASDPAAILGDIRVDLNGTVTTLNGQTLTDFGDSLDRSIGVGRHPSFSSDHFRGQIYAPAVYLGVSEVPEPGTTALLGLGGLALILRRRR
ncbi:PEP-CTERM sorting domain-containing protein [Verrucomicrobiaceae bacterium N1E253]|uniref:PEP-CTERM sorting domain-containing protein n=1 Tax=Oceaniferula marina TaxID=2748318 RepID=A0A851GK18_9BACT|nr:PEP-CTERM sorting domain-containing protein [Oceaniferula marina]NWK54514.1 PEP-CTERM sorting domain-containing protein [Oceaniferula marina]